MWEKHGDDVSGCALIADIDECAEEEARCSDAQYCVNKPGSFSCRGTQCGPVSSVAPCVRCVAVCRMCRRVSGVSSSVAPCVVSDTVGTCRMSLCVGTCRMGLCVGTCRMSLCVGTCGVSLCVGTCRMSLCVGTCRMGHVPASNPFSQCGDSCKC